MTSRPVDGDTASEEENRSRLPEAGVAAAAALPKVLRAAPSARMDNKVFMMDSRWKRKKTWAPDCAARVFFSSGRASPCHRRRALICMGFLHMPSQAPRSCDG